MKDFMNTADALAYLGIARATLYKYVNENKVKVYKSKTGSRKSYFSKTELDALKGFIPAKELPQIQKKTVKVEAEYATELQRRETLIKNGEMKLIDEEEAEQELANYIDSLYEETVE